jgi:hypothetical protein
VMDDDIDTQLHVRRDHGPMLGTGTGAANGRIGKSTWEAPNDRARLSQGRGTSSRVNCERRAV